MSLIQKVSIKTCLCKIMLKKYITLYLNTFVKVLINKLDEILCFNIKLKIPLLWKAYWGRKGGFKYLIFLLIVHQIN